MHPHFLSLCFSRAFSGPQEDTKRGFFILSQIFTAIAARPPRDENRPGFGEGKPYRGKRKGAAQLSGLVLPDKAKRSLLWLIAYIVFAIEAGLFMPENAGGKNLSDCDEEDAPANARLRAILCPAGKGVSTTAAGIAGMVWRTGVRLRFS